MKIKKILKSIWDEFIYGGHLQLLGAASVVFISALLLKIKISWDILIISYLIFYPVYSYNRFKEINIDRLTNPERTQYFKKYLKFIPTILVFAVLILISGLAYFANTKALMFSLFLFVFGILYTIVFKKITRKIYLFKNLYVSAFYFLLVFFPIIYYSYFSKTSLMISALLLGMFISFKAFMVQIFLDIKDIESDKREKLRTLPVILGKEKTLIILSVSNLVVTIAVPIILSLYLNIFSKLMLMFIFTIPFDFYCYSLAKKEKYFGYILQSGEFFLWLFLILIGKAIL